MSRRTSSIAIGLHCLVIVILLHALLFFRWSADLAERRSMDAERARLLYSDGFKGGFEE